MDHGWHGAAVGLARQSSAVLAAGGAARGPDAYGYGYGYGPYGPWLRLADHQPMYDAMAVISASSWSTPPASRLDPRLPIKGRKTSGTATEPSAAPGVAQDPRSACGRPRMPASR